MAHHPFLHDLVVAVRAPLQAWSAGDGQITGEGLQGFYCGDERVLSQVGLEVADHSLVATGRYELGGGRVRFDYVLRRASRDSDPTVVLSRFREVTAEGMTESVRVTSHADAPIKLQVRVRLTPDATPLAKLRAGEIGTPLHVRKPAWQWRGDATSATLSAPKAKIAYGDAAIGCAWDLTIPAGGTADAAWSLAVSDRGALVAAAGPEGALGVPRVKGEGTDALWRLMYRSFEDLEALRVTAGSKDCFLAAGAPWYFTLFGRDSLIASRMLLPVNRELALSTLRALVARQGAKAAATGEQPGKILQELRRSAPGGEASSYGSIDATLLWILVLHDAWRAGAADESIRSFVPALRAALTWLRDEADPDRDGFLEAAGGGTQGWRETEAVRFADGRQAEGPLALVEVQGYAYAAARAGARLLNAFGRTPGERAQSMYWDRWAEGLSARFRATFWVEDARGRFPALALDGQKRPVDAVASTMGHLVGTGILERDEEVLVVQRLMADDVFSGYGIRSLSAAHPGYWPLGYQVGSVWTHDNAMIIEALLRSGFRDEARTVAAGQLRAAEGLGYQLPELFGGQSEDDHFPPHPYPGSGRPAATAAASAVPIARALGVDFL